MALAATLQLTACDDGHLRGSVVASETGKTYLAVVDDNGGKCSPIFVDGNEWHFAIGEAGQIEPGVHTIGCGATTELTSFEVPPGVVFSFDYWGP